MSTDLEEVARLVPDYELGPELGRGEFGVVWRARHVQLDRAVAIKQLARPVVAGDEYSARFRREARILAHLDHPHVVRVFDYREAGELRLLVMELLTGSTFADRRVAGMTLETTVAATMAAASGLHHVHEQGVLHRDVKPENLMFDGRGVLKVTDFGIARGDALGTTVVNLTHAGEFFGTPAYVAPEQAALSFGGGWPAVTAAADQYSLAAVLYEALSGQLTHDASGGVVGLCMLRMNEPARPLRAVAPDVPEEVGAVVMRSLARDPAERYASVDEMGVALGMAMQHSAGPDWIAGSDVTIREAGPIRDSAGGRQAETTRERTPPKKSPLRWVAPALVVLGVVLAVAAISVFRGGSDGGVGTNGAAPTPAASGDLPLAIDERWTFATGGNVFATPAVAGDVVVVGSEDGTVYGLEASSGAERWRHATGGPVRSSAAVDGDRLYVGSLDGNLYALDPQSGNEVWKTPTGFEVVSSPAVSAGVVVVGADGVRAFDAATGAERWRFPIAKGVVSSPAIAGETIVVGGNDGNVYGLALADGTERWRLTTGGAVQSSPTVDGGVAYVGSLDGSLYAIDATTGEERFATDLGAALKSSPHVDGGRVFVGTDSGRLVAIDAKRGDVRWSFGAIRAVDSSPVVVNGNVVVGANDGNVYAVAAADGTLQGMFDTIGPVLSSPVAVGDLVVIGGHDDQVYGLEGFRGQ